MLPQLDIIYEDENLLVLNKQAGVSVHPSLKEPNGTLVNALVERFPEIKGVGKDPQRPGIVHRLDKDTSGVLVVAKTQKVFEELKELFKSRKIRKRYLAIVQGKVLAPRGVINFPIGRLGIKKGVEQNSKKPLPKTREAKTNFIVRKKLSDATLLELLPETGRMHQLRVHLKAIEHPVLGDKLYGGKVDVGRAGRQMLHALSISFSLFGQSFTFEADPPQDFITKLEELTIAGNDNENVVIYE